MTDRPNPAAPPGDPLPRTPAELKAVLARTQAGDASALPVVRRLLADPAMLGVFGGELAETAMVSFVKAMGGDDVGFREAVQRKLELLRADLLGESPTPVERLLAERVAACWLQVQDAEIRYAQGQKDLSIRQADYHQRRMDAANRRFLAAVRTLALVRKLAVPALQVNIARKQVNVVAPGGAG